MNVQAGRAAVRITATRGIKKIQESRDVFLYSCVMSLAAAIQFFTGETFNCISYWLAELGVSFRGVSSSSQIHRLSSPLRRTGRSGGGESTHLKEKSMVRKVSETGKTREKCFIGRWSAAQLRERCSARRTYEYTSNSTFNSQLTRIADRWSRLTPA